jgi:hypothetical protein
MKKCILIGAAALLPSCTSMSRAMELGGAMGAASSAIAVSWERASGGDRSPKGDILVASSIGLGVGLMAAYLIQKSSEEHIASSAPEVDMHFGDLPPSPFLFPTTSKKGASR